MRIVIKWRTFKRYLRGKVMQACMCFCARVCVSVRMHAVARLRVLACACVRVRVWLYGSVCVFPGRGRQNRFCEYQCAHPHR